MPAWRGWQATAAIITISPLLNIYTPNSRSLTADPNTRPLTWMLHSVETILSNDLQVKIRHACLTSNAYSGMSPEACVARPRGRGDHVPSLGFPGLASHRSMPFACSHAIAALVLRCAAGTSLATSSAAPCRSVSVNLYKGEGIDLVFLYGRDRP